jgi:hypothetical protein
MAQQALGMDRLVRQTNPNDHYSAAVSFPKMIRSSLGLVFIWFPFTATPIVGSLFTAVGGTLMQVIGVYRTCFCYVNAQWWLHLDASPGVNLASDTAAARLSSRNWLQAGIVATGFMTVVCYLGWAYQESLRHLFREEVRKIEYDVSGNRTRSDGRELSEGVGGGVDAVRPPSVEEINPWTGLLSGDDGITNEAAKT